MGAGPCSWPTRATRPSARDPAGPIPPAVWRHPTPGWSSTSSSTTPPAPSCGRSSREPVHPSGHGGVRGVSQTFGPHTRRGERGGRLVKPHALRPEGSADLVAMSEKLGADPRRVCRRLHRLEDLAGWTLTGARLALVCRARPCHTSDL